MNLTPRQISAYLSFSFKLDRSERANMLAMSALGAQGSETEIKRVLKELSDHK